MDKNTVIGVILITLVFLGFMWLGPKQESQQADKKVEQAEQAEQPKAMAEPLSATEREWLVKNISENGTTVRGADSTYVTTLNSNGLNLSLRGDSIYGSVTVDNVEIPWSEVTAAHPTGFTVAQQAKALDAVRAASVSVGKYGKFAQFLAGKDSEVALENDVLSLRLSAKGGSITRAELKKYDTEYNADENAKTQKRRVVLFEGKSNSFGLEIPMPQPVATSDLYFTPQKVNDSTVLMSVQPADGAWWGIEYTLPRGESYMVRMRVVQHNMAAVAQSNNRDLTFTWNQDLRRQEKGRMFEERNSGLYYKFAGGSVEHLNEKGDDSEERQAKVRWIGFKNQFFSSVVVSDRPFNTADFNSKEIKGADYLKSLSASAVVNDYDWNAEVPATFHIFLGPNLYPLLSGLDDKVVPDEDMNFTKLIPLGWSIFRWINTLIIIPVFSFLGSFGWNYGIIILILTILIKVVLFPLSYKSYKSQAKMRILAPDIKAINDKYPGQENAMKRQQKTMELYSKAGASPFSGCLPMLLQMPILFAVFSFFPSCIELRGQSFLWAHDLSAPDAIISWSGNIPLVTEYFGNHISLFCLLMTATNIGYTYINMQNNAGSTMPGMKWMMYLMPVFFMVLFNNYAAGLSYYYFLSLLITIAQTYAFRMAIKPETVRKAIAEAAKKPRKKSGFMARLEEMQKQQQAMLREQQKRGGNSK